MAWPEDEKLFEIYKSVDGTTSTLSTIEEINYLKAQLEKPKIIKALFLPSALSIQQRIKDLTLFAFARKYMMALIEEVLARRQDEEHYNETILKCRKMEEELESYRRGIVPTHWLRR